MCGISAVKLARHHACIPPSQLDRRLGASLKAMEHRGPDSSGIYTSDDGLVGLAHTRLAIIDLEGGQQPLHDESGHVHAVVTGELYDYATIRADLEAKGCQFQSSVDSELIVHLYKVYGQNLVHHLRGEFAFVLYDVKRQLVLAARDRFGVKPLYYTVIDGSLLIASEMKALPPLGWEPEWDISSIAEMGEFFDHRTVFKGVFKLPAAHLLTFNSAGHLEKQMYWDHASSFPNANVAETRTVDEMIHGVRSRLVDSVKARLRSDVPLAIYLSGGIDSCAVAGIAASLLKEQDSTAKLTTLTLSFPARKNLDEGPIAKRMADFIGADSFSIAPSEADLVDRFEKAVYHCETPIFNLQACGKVILAEFAYEKGFRVVLTGEGSDETFAGYTLFEVDYFRAADPASKNLGFPLPTPSELARILKEAEERPAPQDFISTRQMSFTDSQLARGMLGGVANPRLCANTVVNPVIDERILESVGNPEPALTVAEAITPQTREKAIKGEMHPLHVALHVTSTTVLSNMILNVLGERTEMATSIEGRPAFLDHYLVEYANSLPPSVKIKPSLIEDEDDSRSSLIKKDRQWKFTEKWILREAVKPYVTEEVYSRTKSIYNAPIARSPPHLNGTTPTLTPMQALLKERITKKAIAELGWVNESYVLSLLDGYIGSAETPSDGGIDRRARLLLCVLSFIILKEKFNVRPHSSSAFVVPGR